MVDQPRLGDAFGQLMVAAFAELTGARRRASVGAAAARPTIEIVERDDGLIDGSLAARYFSGPDRWQPFDLRALDQMRGRTLDIGTGAGRLALALQERDIPVVALDTSAGAIEVAAARGVRTTVRATVDEHAASGERYDCFALFGNNLGLLESAERAPTFLAALAAMARPGAVIVGQGMNPYLAADEVHTSYHARNRAAGRMGGQLRLRVRHRRVATEWFDYLLCSPEELGQLVRGTPWELVDVDTVDLPCYLVTLRLRGRG